MTTTTTFFQRLLSVVVLALTLVACLFSQTNAAQLRRHYKAHRHPKDRKQQQLRHLNNNNNTTKSVGNNPQIDTRIVGGSKASPNEYPFHVQWMLGCGGTVIHTDLVLTAAHCHFNENVLERFSLYVGGDGTSKSGVELHATQAFIHPMYDPEATQAYDFMVLKLPEAVPDSVKPLQWNTDRSVPSSTESLTVMGFGLLDEADKPKDAPSHLQHVTVTHAADCAQYYGNDRINDDIVFCAGVVPDGGKDACQGDSGGPILDDATGLLVGTVSWGIGCARKNRPGVYARVSAIDRWLEHLKCHASDFPPEDCVPLNIELKVDDYPQELGYVVKSSDHPEEQTMVFVPPGTFEDVAPGANIRLMHKIPAGNYTLQLQDTGDDGFCCEYGNGQMVITDQDKEPIVVAEFNNASMSVDLPYVGTPQNEMPGYFPDDLFALHVQIMYDLSHISTLTWKLLQRNEETGEETLIYEDAAGNPDRELDQNRRQYKDFRNLDPGLYVLQTEDSYDPPEFAEGMGFVRVFEMDNVSGDIEARLVHVSGHHLRAVTTQTFSLGLSTPAPTEAPEPAQPQNGQEASVSRPQQTANTDDNDNNDNDNVAEVERPASRPTPSNVAEVARPERGVEASVSRPRERNGNESGSK